MTEKFIMNKVDLKTKRLTIRLIEEDDWQSIQKIWLDFNNSDYVIYDNKKNTDEMDVRARIARWADASKKGFEHIFFVSCLEGEVIGFVSMNKVKDGYEVGYGFKDKAHGKGYAKESMRAILDYMKEIGTKRIFAGTAIKNEPSVRLLEGLDFKLTAREEVTFHKDSAGNDIYFEGGNFVREL